MGKIIAVANQKGGVGKTTTCVSLAAVLHSRYRKVLLCDADPQGNATSGFGVPKDSRPNMYDLLINGAEAAETVVRTEFGDMLPTGKELSGANVEMVELPRREFLMKDRLEELKGRYDYIFIDCPPSLELLTLNALVAADSVLIPVQCEYYAMEGLTDLITTIKLTTRRLNPGLRIEGILMTMHDGRTNFSEQVAGEVRKYFGELVYSTMIPRNVRLAEAPSHGRPISSYDKLSKGSRAYQKLAAEFLKRQTMATQLKHSY